MSNQDRQLRHETEQEQNTTQQNSSTSHAALEFNTAEEAIRHDAAGTALPSAIAERLKKSIEQAPPPGPRPWWKKMFGG